MSKTTKPNENKFNRLINVVSIIIPLAVALLFGVRLPNVEPLIFLPPIYASMNGITSVLLIGALIAIKNKKVYLHENLMKTSVACSLLFLLMYVAYHMTSDPTEYKGNVPFLYYFILISHIILSIVVIPLVLHSYSRAYFGEYKAHKKIVKYAFPVWLYVAVTGVIVYIMISPFYSQTLRLIFTFLVVFNGLWVNAQCAMCRAVLESEAGQNTAKGVNDGIVYLMIIPYVLVGGIAFLVYKKLKKTS